LRSRLSYQVEYDSNPPPGQVSTDTHTRATLIYGF
jgi:putative salt-induced outer membrane protein